MSELKLLYATDLHGCGEAWKELAAVARRVRPTAIVLGGDLLPKEIASYPDDRAEEGFQRLRLRQERFVRSFLPMWLKRAPSKVFWMLGNDDMGYLAESFARRDLQEKAHYIHDRVQFLREPWKIFGYAYVPVTPFSLKDWEKFDDADQEDPTSYRPVFSTPDGFLNLTSPRDVLIHRGTIGDDLARLSVMEWGRTILVIHSPPLGTKLDVLYNGRHVGSKAVRDLIARAQPPLSLHGHIHESPLVSGSVSDRIGGTICVNPGDSSVALRAVMCVERRGAWEVVPMGSGFAGSSPAHR